MSEQSAPAITSPASEEVVVLLGQAMRWLENDRSAARRCLQHASALLHGAPLDSGLGDIEKAYRLCPGGLAPWQARRILTYIELNLGRRIAVSELSGIVGTSPSHFSRSFMRSFGSSPMTYVSRRRLERAKCMMTTTMRLAEIALACGFADQPHFNNSFRRWAGVSPGHWRRCNLSGLITQAPSG